MRRARGGCAPLAGACRRRLPTPAPVAWPAVTPPPVRPARGAPRDPPPGRAPRAHTTTADRARPGRPAVPRPPPRQQGRRSRSRRDRRTHPSGRPRPVRRAISGRVPPRPPRVCRTFRTPAYRPPASRGAGRGRDTAPCPRSHRVLGGCPVVRPAGLPAYRPRVRRRSSYRVWLPLRFQFGGA